MKKLLALALAAILALSIVGCSDSEDNDDYSQNNSNVANEVLVYENFEYAVNDSGNFEIVGYTYTGVESISIEVPSSIDGRPVTGIGNEAFKSVTTMSEIKIPDSIEYIGNFAFDSCTGLTAVTLPNSVKTVGIGAFWGCSKMTSLTLSANLVEIGNYAFWDCEKLGSVTLPETLKTIGDGAFWNCKSLAAVSIPDSVETVGMGAFIYCDALTEASFLSASVEIGDGAFDYCSDSLIIVGSSDDCTAKAFAEDNGITFKLFSNVE